MRITHTTLFEKIFKDKKGNVVIWQNPNILLWGWVASSGIGVIFDQGHIHTGFQHIARASLFGWAYLEIRSGVNLFRRTLGFIVIASIIYGFFTL